jgi:hypothetical protein
VKKIVMADDAHSCEEDKTVMRPIWKAGYGCFRIKIVLFVRINLRIIFRVNVVHSSQIISTLSVLNDYPGYENTRIVYGLRE